MADLAELLLTHNEIDWNQLESARGQQQFSGARLEHILVEARMVPERRLADAIARVTHTERALLDELSVDGAALAKMDGDTCWKEVVFPVAVADNGRTLHVAFTDPIDIGLTDRIGQITGCRVVPKVAGLNEIRRAIRRHYYGEAVATPEEEAPSENAGEEVFKITDMAGHTVVTARDQVKPAAPAAPVARAPEPPPPPVAGDPADVLFDVRALGPEERARLKKVAANQAKSARVLSALIELLEERGYLTRAEVEDR